MEIISESLKTPSESTGQNNPPVPSAESKTNDNLNKNTGLSKLTREPDTTGIDTKADKTREEDLHPEQAVKK